MVKLLIIADDFTGALDTGIQFAKKGIYTQIAADKEIQDIAVIGEAQVLVVDLETRPKSGREAYDAVRQILMWAQEQGVPAIYKKTDSALRGNIGAELQAVADAADGNVYFIPAFPEIGRVTLDGIHYIEGVPISQSAFGKDPFEPVRHSYIPDIISESSEIDTICVSCNDYRGGYLNAGGKKIIVFDAETDDTIKGRIRELKSKNQLKFLAGCAGFASFLPDALGLKGGDGGNYERKPGMYVACGSLNPITREQIEFAVERGFKRINLKPVQKLDINYYNTDTGKKFLEEIKNICKNYTRVVVDTFDLDDPEATDQFAKEQGMSAEEIRYAIARCHGFILRYLVEQGMDYTLFMTGGDTLMGFMKSLDNPQLTPICEISQGVVLSQIGWKGKILQVVSKSGGFGQQSVIADIAVRLTTEYEEEQDEVCNDAICLP